MLWLYNFNATFSNNNIKFIIYVTIICWFFFVSLLDIVCHRTDSDADNLRLVWHQTHIHAVYKTGIKIPAYIITSITPRPIVLTAMLAVMHVSIYMTAVILYISWHPVLLDKETRVLDENHRRIMYIWQYPVRLVCVNLITIILSSAHRHPLTRFHLLQYQNCKQKYWGDIVGLWLWWTWSTEQMMKLVIIESERCFISTLTLV